MCKGLHPDTQRLTYRPFNTVLGFRLPVGLFNEKCMFITVLVIILVVSVAGLIASVAKQDQGTVVPRNEYQDTFGNEEPDWDKH